MINQTTLHPKGFVLVKYLIEQIWKSKEILRLIFLLSIFSLALVVYIDQQVNMAIIKRKIHKLNNDKKELQSRNQALKKALGKLARDLGSPFWQSYQEFAPHEKNKIVRIKMPPLP